MAYYQGAFSSEVAGTLLTVLDEKLPLTSTWSIYDAAAGANCKVYRCYDAAGNCDFYLKVDDNFTQYATLELWQGWDNVGHVGVGSSVRLIGANTYRFWKYIGGWSLVVGSHRFIYIHKKYWLANYIGQLKRFDVTKNMPAIISNSQSSYINNPLGTVQSDGQTHWHLLFDEAANPDVLLAPFGWTSPAKMPLGCHGSPFICETPCYGDTTKKLIGQLDGAVHVYTTSPGPMLQNGSLYWSGNDPWVAVGGWATATIGSQFSLVRLT